MLLHGVRTLVCGILHPGSLFQHSHALISTPPIHIQSRIAADNGSSFFFAASPRLVHFWFGELTMAKKSSKRGRSSRDATVWSACDHDIRKAKRQRKSDEKREERENRSALLTRGSREKREEGKLRLHIVRVQRQVERLRSRLEVWHDVEEKANRVQAEELEK